MLERPVPEGGDDLDDEVDEAPGYTAAFAQLHHSSKVESDPIVEVDCTPSVRLVGLVPVRLVGLVHGRNNKKPSCAWRWINLYYVRLAHITLNPCHETIARRIMSTCSAVAVLLVYPHGASGITHKMQGILVIQK
eukprot:1194485-Prorocentrum_minimum.AAC.1